MTCAIGAACELNCKFRTAFGCCPRWRDYFRGSKSYFEGHSENARKGETGKPFNTASYALLTVMIA